MKKFMMTAIHSTLIRRHCRSLSYNTITIDQKQSYKEENKLAELVNDEKQHPSQYGYSRDSDDGYLGKSCDDDDISICNRTHRPSQYGYSRDSDDGYFGKSHDDDDD